VATAEIVQADEGTESSAEINAAEPAGTKRKKLIVIVAAALLLVLGGGGAAWYLLGGDRAAAAAETNEPPPTAEELVDVAEMSVNLRTSDGSTKLLRVHLMLVPGAMGKEEVTASLPLVVDAFQPFLRELRPEDIAGSAATFRIKEEMLVRANAVLGRQAVKDVLIQELVQQ